MVCHRTVTDAPDFSAKYFSTFSPSDCLFSDNLLSLSCRNYLPCKKGKITAKKPGKATIIAKVKGKKLKCRVIVEKRKKYNVRKLRDYIVKKGRKYGSNYVIENVDVDGEQTEYIAEISARKNTTEMIFKYTIRPDVTAGSSYLYEFHIDLANKSSGRFNWYAEAFKALDRLLKVKKTGVTMNSIGFTKWK